MLNRADEACDVIQKHIKNDETIRIISHNDADGISAAAVLANALKEENTQFHTTIIPRLRPDIIDELKTERYELFIFLDMGSAYLKELDSFKSDVIIADHHQISDYNPGKHLTHVNPHLFGIDGSKDLCGAGSSYLSIRNMGKEHLAYFALIGAFGDMQGQNGFTGINKFILDDGLNAGNVEIHEGLKLVSKSSEPLFKSLAYTFSPALPGLTGDFEESMGFLEKMGLSYGIKFTDLEGEERDILKDELIKINPNIFGDIYSVPKENKFLTDLEEYSYILDACGKNKKFGLGLSISLGEREKALNVALDLQRKYRDQLVKGLEWIKKEGAVNLDYIQYLYSEDKVLKSVMGTIASIGISTSILDVNKPVIGISRLVNDIKISGRTTRELVDKGVNLGKAFDDASKNFSGQGGGHDIAAGAMVPYESMDNFLNIVNDIIEHQLNN
ncbi:MAG: DHH family phosphoesterase [Methanobacteriaceae archaeon]|nr:DHH family phosphoesterase [Methanobacteriaceae archaeon]